MERFSDEGATQRCFCGSKSTRGDFVFGLGDCEKTSMRQAPTDDALPTYVADPGDCNHKSPRTQTLRRRPVPDATVTLAGPLLKKLQLDRSINCLKGNVKDQRGVRRQPYAQQPLVTSAAGGP
eukprot:m.87823 g.87823  ORF g.87823 m.87823 type:complete len:123 (+) comp11587_c0_seq2:2174-2542(+)